MARAIDTVVEAWLHGRTCRKGNVSTDGKIIYSYSAPIGIHKDNGDFEVLTTGVYSVTTSKHCNQVASACPSQCMIRVSKTELEDTIDG